MDVLKYKEEKRVCGAGRECDGPERREEEIWGNDIGDMEEWW